MASLAKLVARDDGRYCPTQGPAIENPKARLRALIEHRRMRERQILERMTAGEGTITAMVSALYTDVDPVLHPAAARSVLAHLIDLQTRGRVRFDGEVWSFAA